MAEPGFVTVRPGSGLIMMPPVSVCHQCRRSDSGRPDVLVIPHPCLGVDRLADAAEQAQRRQVVLGRSSSPHFMHARIAVGAVYIVVTRYFSTSAHQRSLPGVSGVPSYISEVAPLASGP